MPLLEKKYAASTACQLKTEEAVRRSLSNAQNERRRLTKKRKQNEKVSNQLQLWFWSYLVGRSYLALSRVGEADNPGPVCARTELCVAHFGRNGHGTDNFDLERSGTGATVRASWCMWTRCLADVLSNNPFPTAHHRPVRTSTPPTSTATATLRLLPLILQFVSHTELGIPSLFQDGERRSSGWGRRPQLKLQDMSGREQNILFCHRTKRDGRKHTGRQRKLEIAEGAVNILQCSVTAWSEHATSEFVAALVSETHPEEAKPVGWVVRRSAPPTQVRVRECSRWFANAGTPNPCQNAQSKLGSFAQTHGWLGRRFGTWGEKTPCCSRPAHVARDSSCPDS